MTILKALGCGLPVVSNDCDFGPAEIIEHGINGYLIPDGDCAVFAHHLAELMDAEPRRLEMGHQALARSESFSSAKITESWQELLSSRCGA